MLQTTTNTDNSFSIELLKQLAFMQHEGEDYFILNGKAYEGNEKELHKEWIETTEKLANAQEWDEYIEDNCSEVEEFDNDDYYVLTDEEADEKAAEYIKDSLWAFNASFLSQYTDLPEEVFTAMQDKCEGANDTFETLIERSGGIKGFIEEAISADGRGHFMSSYDGEENEETVQSETFYIYRLN